MHGMPQRALVSAEGLSHKEHATETPLRKQSDRSLPMPAFQMAPQKP